MLRASIRLGPCSYSIRVLTPSIRLLPTQSRGFTRKVQEEEEEEADTEYPVDDYDWRKDPELTWQDKTGPETRDPNETGEQAEFEQMLDKLKEKHLRNEPDADTWEAEAHKGFDHLEAQRNQTRRGELENQLQQLKDQATMQGKGGIPFPEDAADLPEWLAKQNKVKQSTTPREAMIEMMRHEREQSAADKLTKELKEMGDSEAPQVTSIAEAVNKRFPTLWTTTVYCITDPSHFTKHETEIVREELAELKEGYTALLGECSEYEETKIITELLHDKWSRACQALEVFDLEPGEEKVAKIRKLDASYQKAVDAATSQSDVWDQVADRKESDRIELPSNKDDFDGFELSDDEDGSDSESEYEEPR